MAKKLDPSSMIPMQDPGSMGPMQGFGALGSYFGGERFGGLGPIGGRGALALEAEGRLNGVMGAKLPGIWGPCGPTWGPWLLSPLGGLLVWLS